MVSNIHNYAAKMTSQRVFGEVSKALQLCTGSIQLSTGVAEHAQSLRGGTAPLSINLDLTTTCNYACVHCIDAELLNTRHKFSFDTVVRSLSVLRMAGLRSVIVIGGGEPTLFPRFRAVIEAIKLLGLQCAIVSNGSRNSKLIEAAPLLTKGDWIRLSLDAATEQTFQAMHRLRSRKKVSLESICTSARQIKAANPNASLGFSFIVTWPGSSVYGQEIIDNIDEMAAAARLAKGSGFDYIAFKPLLDRDDRGGEVVDVPGDSTATVTFETIIARIEAQLRQCYELVDDGFGVHESINLAILKDPRSYAHLKHQPRHCYMHLFRQVLTPIGIYGCPVYRGSDRDRIGEPAAYSSPEGFVAARQRTYQVLSNLDVSSECANVSCLYNSSNWWFDSIVHSRIDPKSIAQSSEQRDLFL